MLLVSVVESVVVVAKVVAIVVVAVDLAPVAIAGFCLPLAKDRFELNRESLLEGGPLVNQMLLVSVVVAVVIMAKVVVIVVVVVDLAPVAIAGFSLPLAKDRFELDRESLFERGAMGGSRGEGKDLNKVLNEGGILVLTK